MLEFGPLYELTAPVVASRLNKVRVDLTDATLPSATTFLWFAVGTARRMLNYSCTRSNLSEQYPAQDTMRQPCARLKGTVARKRADALVKSPTFELD